MLCSRPVSTSSTPNELMAAWAAFGEDKVGQNEIVLNTWLVDTNRPATD